MKSTREVVLTGIGVLNAAGQNRADFWRSMQSGTGFITAIDRFDVTDYPIKVAGQIRGFTASSRIPRRFVAKTDRFTHYALATSDEAIADAGLDIDGLDRDRIGVWFGNNTGGWDLCEQGFEEYYTQGPSLVNPWQATAWFLAAPQGFTTIRYGIRGASKSFSGDRTSGASAIYYGTRSLQWGTNDVVLTGGCEAPISPLSLLCFHASGDLSADGTPATAYRPFHVDSTGLVVGEGSITMVLEAADHARSRGAQVHARILGGAHGTVHLNDTADYLTVLERALKDAQVTFDDIDLILCEGSGRPADDAMEAAALQEAMGGRDIPVAVPKAMFGHLYGAAFGTDVVCAVEAMRSGRRPASDMTTGPFSERADIRNALIVSYSRYGSCVAMVVGRPDNDDRNR